MTKPYDKEIKDLKAELKKVKAQNVAYTNAKVEFYDTNLKEAEIAWSFIKDAMADLFGRVCKIEEKLEIKPVADLEKKDYEVDIPGEEVDKVILSLKENPAPIQE